MRDHERWGAGLRWAALATVAVALTGCTTTTQESPPAASACEVALPAAWREAFEASGVATGGSTTPLAVGPAGEVAAVRDNGPTRDLLLIEPDGSITTSYTVPDPDGGDRDFTTITEVAVDDAWIVVGVSSEPGDSRPTIRDGKPIASNGPGPSMKRIDVIDRRNGSVRTIASSADLDDAARAGALASIVLHQGTVYWLTGNRETYAGTLRSYDLNGGPAAEVAAGQINGLRATTSGLAWFTTDRDPVVHNVTPLPTAIATIPGIDEGQSTLVDDGTHFAWLTGLADGGTGLAWWSPDTGLTKVATDQLFAHDGTSALPPPVYLAWPYVVLGPGRGGSGSAVVDTRSGAIATVDDAVAGAGGGTIATQSSAPGVAPFIPRIAGLVRTDALPPLTC